jgi:protein involved in polysaccharide export with SLBB domain
MKKVLLILILNLLFISVVEAQSFDDVPAFNTKSITQFSDRPAQYILGSGDILLVNVNLWGHVQRPGIYSIPSSYTLIDLISSAGGPLKTARLNDVRIVRKNQEVIQVDVNEFLKTGNNELLPVLQPGDTIMVSGSVQDMFSRFVGLMRDIAIIVNVFVLANRMN